MLQATKVKFFIIDIQVHNQIKSHSNFTAFKPQILRTFHYTNPLEYSFHGCKLHSNLPSFSNVVSAHTEHRKLDPKQNMSADNQNEKSFHLQQPRVFKK